MRAIFHQIHGKKIKIHTAWCLFLLFRGRYLVALGRSWHPEEFTCNQCNMTLTEGGFFEEKGSVFCGKCYENMHAPNCAKCKQKIIGVSNII